MFSQSKSLDQSFSAGQIWKRERSMCDACNLVVVVSLFSFSSFFPFFYIIDTTTTTKLVAAVAYTTTSLSFDYTAAGSNQSRRSVITGADSDRHQGLLLRPLLAVYSSIPSFKPFYITTWFASIYIFYPTRLWRTGGREKRSISRERGRFLYCCCCC